MLSATEHQNLVSLCDQFINCGEEITLAHLIDAVNATIPDRSSHNWKEWTKHMEQLNEAWTMIVKEGVELAWPTVCTSLNIVYSVSTTF